MIQNSDNSNHFSSCEFKLSRIHYIIQCTLDILKILIYLKIFSHLWITYLLNVNSYVKVFSHKTPLCLIFFEVKIKMNFPEKSPFSCVATNRGMFPSIFHTLHYLFEGYGMIQLSPSLERQTKGENVFPCHVGGIFGRRRVKIMC